MDVQCRLCLGQTSAKLVLSLTNEEMRLMIDAVFNFEIMCVSYLSESVCLQCSSTVQEFYHYSRRVRRNQELLEGESLDKDDKSCESVEFENVNVDGTVCESIKIEPSCESDHQVEDPQDTIDNCEKFQEVEYSSDVYADVSDEFDVSNIEQPPDAHLQGFEGHSEISDNVAGETLENAEETVMEQQADGATFQDRFLRCNTCDRLFSNVLHFRSHQREHRKKHCPICPKSMYAKYLLEHIADAHKAKPMERKRVKTIRNILIPSGQYERDRMIDVFIGLRCDLCQFGITHTFADLQKHYRTKHAVQGYVRCCGNKFTNQSAAAEHVLMHQGTIRCEICDKTFSSKSGLVKHKDLLHPARDGPSGARVFRCKLCHVVFTNKMLFINHRSEHERKHCPICGKSIRKSYMKKHIADVHDASSKDGARLAKGQSVAHPHVNDQTILNYLGMHCELCPPEVQQKFDQFKDLRTHYRTEHNIRGYVRCCDRQFFVRSLAAEHIAAHQGKLRCHLCDKTFTARCSVANHIATMHPSDSPSDRSYDCDECDRHFSNKLQLRLHKKRHQLTSTECSLCGRSVRSDYIQHHIATQHGAKRRKLMCHICGKDFASEAILNVHIKQHVSPDAGKTDIQRSQCTICNKMIKGKYSMRKHIKDMHSDGSNQECTICGKFIRSYTAMKQHLKMHQGLGREKLQCPFCAKWVKGKNYLSKHIQCLHNEKGQVFRCDVCQHQSPNSQALAAHRQRVHEHVQNRELLECEYCGKNFKRMIYLREHVALHTGELLYTCEFCGKKFKSNANYYSHRKKYHTEELQEKNENQTKSLVSS